MNKRWLALFLVTAMALESPMITYAAESEFEVIEESEESEVPGTSTEEPEESEVPDTGEEITEEPEVPGTGEEITEEPEVPGTTLPGTGITEANEKLAQICEAEDVLALVYLTDCATLKEEPSSDAQGVLNLQSGDSVLIHGIAVDENNTVWYLVTYAIDETQMYEGYLEKEKLIYTNESLLAWEETYLSCYFPTFVTPLGEAVAGKENLQEEINRTADEIASFPESYRSYLATLAASHPNWHFVRYNTNVDFDVMAENENIGGRSLIHSSLDASWREDNTQVQPGWYKPKLRIVKHFLDPRNFLSEPNIFMFEELTYNSSYQNLESVQGILNGSFMEGKVPGDSFTYASYFLQAGIDSKVSPFHLAARVRQEQGAGTSGLISGTYPGYEGYYNYFNIKASGSTTDAIIRNGLAYAKSKDWNSRYKSIIGGANFIGSGYINIGQDTLYLQKFDTVGEYYTHQYMQNLTAPKSESSNLYKAYANAGSLNKPFVFKIPVYNNMPTVPCSTQEGVARLDRTSVTLEYLQTDVWLRPFLDGVEEDVAKFTWTTSDAMVCKVYANGNIVGYKPGTATITATYVGDKALYKGKKATCKVTVNGLFIDTGSGMTTDSLALRAGTTTPLQVVYKFPSNATNKTITYSSSKTEVATVDTKGVITTLKAGDTIVTVSGGGYTREVTVKVVPAYFTLKNTQIFMNPAEQQQVELTLAEEFESTSTKYSSSNEAVAKISDSGMLQAIACGETTITVSMAGYSQTCTVNVSATVTYHEMKSDDNEKTTLSSIAYGSSIGELMQVAEREGYVFSGWFTQENGAGTRYHEGTVILGDTDLYAYFNATSENFTALTIGDVIYAGAAVKPNVTVYDGTTLLTLNKDYKVSYKNNTNVGTATATVTGIGNYNGSQKIDFNIVAKNISDNDISAASLIYPFNNKVQKQKPVVYRAGKKLTLNKDYTLSYPDTAEGAYKVAGVYTITITGLKNYTGSRTMNIEITNRIPMSKVTFSSIPAKDYANGNPICPNVVLKYKSHVLTEGKEYTVNYSNNTQIGTATVTVTGLKNYIGTVSKTFKIKGFALSGAKVTGLTTMYYAGEAIEQSGYQLAYKGELLEEGKDYSVSYLKNTAVGKASIVFTGKGRFTGTLKKSFDIKAYNILADDKNKITLENIGEVKYQKGGSKPTVLLKFGNTVLEQGKDYTLTYKYNTAVTTADTDVKKLPQVIVKGKGNFAGQLTRTFSIAKSSISDQSMVNLSATDVVFKDKVNAYKSSPVLQDVNGKKLSAGTDYEKIFTYTYADGTEITPTEVVPAGSVIKILVTGRGNYEGSTASVTYRVVQKSIASASVKIAKQIYTGYQIMPATSDITIKVSGVELSSEEYKIVSVSNNVKKGTATIVFEGVGNYGGTKKATFSIGNRGIFW